ncbi:hypothetical protein QLX08_006979 [Tetragonisca angustula]|uniref:Uncharacterized protein n=1 Tax=Tetragonisca angustula TaxID=166442 RepID=A0AAW0ZRB1_9HYME
MQARTNLEKRHFLLRPRETTESLISDLTCGFQYIRFQSATAENAVKVCLSDSGEDRCLATNEYKMETTRSGERRWRGGEMGGEELEFRGRIQFQQNEGNEKAEE